MSALKSITKSIEKYKPKIQTIQKGTKIFRLASRRFPGDALNPHYYADHPDFDPVLDGSRFSPFKARNGRWVPSSYLGQTEEVAVGEVLLRKMPKGAPHYSVTLKQLADLRMFELRLRKDLNFVELRGMALRAIGLMNIDIIGLPQPFYPDTQAFAKAMYEHPLVKAKSAVGMVWTSRQVDDAYALLVWSRGLPKRWLDEAGNWDLDAAHNRPRIEEILSRANVALI